MTVHARNTARPLKDARAAAGPAPVAPLRVVGGKGRTMAAKMWANHLSTATSKAGDTYSRKTIEGYVEAVKIFDEYLTAEGFPGDFADVDVDTVNAFLAHYRTTHTQGGTNTKLRRLRVFFAWVADTFEADDPFATGRVSYFAPSAPPPSALADDVVGDLLAVCKGRAFEDARDTAILTLVKRGVRRGELQGIHVEDVDFANSTVTVRALKDTKRNAPVVRIIDGEEHRLGRVVVVGDDAMVALHKWLRVRAQHKLVKDPTAGPLWYATRGRGRMTGNGILRMVKRRAEEAGYDPATINVHAFRHTRTHTLLAANVNPETIMDQLGWKDRGMLDRYGSNLRSQRARADMRRSGLA